MTISTSLTKMAIYSFLYLSLMERPLLSKLWSLVTHLREVRATLEKMGTELVASSSLSWWRILITLMRLMGSNRNSLIYKSWESLVSFRMWLSLRILVGSQSTTRRKDATILTKNLLREEAEQNSNSEALFTKNRASTHSNSKERRLLATLIFCNCVNWMTGRRWWSY